MQFRRPSREFVPDPFIVAQQEQAQHDPLAESREALVRSYWGADPSGLLSHDYLMGAVTVAIGLKDLIEEKHDVAAREYGCVDMPSGYDALGRALESVVETESHRRFVAMDAYYGELTGAPQHSPHHYQGSPKHIDVRLRQNAKQKDLLEKTSTNKQRGEVRGYVDDWASKEAMGFSNAAHFIITHVMPRPISAEKALFVSSVKRRRHFERYHAVLSRWF